MMKPILACLASLCAGVAIGWLLPRAASETPDEKMENTSSLITKSNSKHSDEPAAAAVSSNASARTSPNSQDEPSANTHGVESGMVKVPAALIRELSRAAGDHTPDENLFSRDGRIEEALGITDHEKAVIQTAWSATRQRIRNAEVTAMKSEQIDEWSVRITVPDLSNSLQTLGGDFHASANRALGKDRSEAFLAARQVDRVFSPPEGERTYTVTTEEIGDGKWRFRFTTEGPAGRRVWVGENIPDEIRHLTEAAGVNPSLGK